MEYLEGLGIPNESLEYMIKGDNSVITEYVITMDLKDAETLRKSIFEYAIALVEIDTGYSSAGHLLAQVFCQLYEKVLKLHYLNFPCVYYTFSPNRILSFRIVASFTKNLSTKCYV